MEDLYAGFPIGIQSYCFRDFETIDRLIQKLRQVELTCVELYPGHLPMETPDEKVHEALARFQAAEIAVSAYGVVPLPADAKRCRRVFDFAEMLGVEAITADPDPEALDVLDRLVEEYGINVAIHNHGPDHRWGRIEAIRKAVEGHHEGIGLCDDTGHFIRAGEDPVEAIRAMPERLFGVHLKDFTRDEAGEWKDAILEGGALDLGEVLSALRAVAFDGFISLEYEGDPRDPLPAIRACLTAVRSAAAKLDR